MKASKCDESPATLELILSAPQQRICRLIVGTEATSQWLYLAYTHGPKLLVGKKIESFLKCAFL